MIDPVHGRRPRLPQMKHNDMAVRTKINIDGPGMVFVTTCVIGRLSVLNMESAARMVLAQLQETLAFYKISLVGYVLMPSHLHLLLGLPQMKLLSQFMQSFKSLSSRKIKEIDLGGFASKLRIRDKFHLWMPCFDEVVIYSDKQLHRKLEYMHNNPVKAGHVKKAIDWKYSSAVDWMSDRAGMLSIDKNFRWQEGVAADGDVCRARYK